MNRRGRCAALFLATSRARQPAELIKTNQPRTRDTGVETDFLTTLTIPLNVPGGLADLVLRRLTEQILHHGGHAAT